MDVYVVVDWVNHDVISVHARMQGAALRQQEYADTMGLDTKHDVTIVNVDLRDEE